MTLRAKSHPATAHWHYNLDQGANERNHLALQNEDQSTNIHRSISKELTKRIGQERTSGTNRTEARLAAVRAMPVFTADEASS